MQVSLVITAATQHHRHHWSKQLHPHFRHAHQDGSLMDAIALLTHHDINWLPVVDQVSLLSSRFAELACPFWGIGCGK